MFWVGVWAAPALPGVVSSLGSWQDELSSPWGVRKHPALSPSVMDHPWVWMDPWESAMGRREKQEFANSLGRRLQ